MLVLDGVGTGGVGVEEGIGAGAASVSVRVYDGGGSGATPVPAATADEEGPNCGGRVLISGMLGSEKRLGAVSQKLRGWGVEVEEKGCVERVKVGDEDSASALFFGSLSIIAPQI